MLLTEKHRFISYYAIQYKLPLRKWNPKVQQCKNHT